MRESQACLVVERHGLKYCLLEQVGTEFGSVLGDFHTRKLEITQ